MECGQEAPAKRKKGSWDWSQVKQQKLSLDHSQPPLDKGHFENPIKTMDPIPS